MSFKSGLLSGRQVIGSWLFCPNTVYVELACKFEIDFVLVDLEHGEAVLQDVPMLLRAAAGGTTAMLVRPPSHDPKTLAKLADFGVDGIVVPKVNTAHEASEIASACRFPPRGTRGIATGAIRASGYGVDADYRRSADDDFLVAVQIETEDGLANRVAISAIDEIDMIFVGPNDLTADLGYPTQCTESSTRIDQLLEDLAGSGKLLGTIPYFGVERAALMKRGISLLVTGSDITAQREYLKELKGVS